MTTLQSYAESVEGKIGTVHTTLAGAGNFKQGLFLFDLAGRIVAASPTSLVATRGTAITDTETQLVQRTLSHPG